MEKSHTPSGSEYHFSDASSSPDLEAGQWDTTILSPQPLSPQPNYGNPLTHFKILYLLIASDLKTTLLPATIFALVANFSGHLLTSTTPSSLISTTTPLIPTTSFNPTTFTLSLFNSILWTLLSLLIFTLSNQRLPTSIAEDTINKPFRPIPLGLLSPSSARRLLLFLLPSTLLLCHFFLGARNEALFLFALTWAYNDLSGGDEHFLIRHALNALGFCTFAAGAAAVMLQGEGRELNGMAYGWLAFIGTAITFTIQFQDMEDQEGDSLRDRKTVPLVIGDSNARVVNAISISTFSVAAPMFWGSLLDPEGVAILGLGGAIAWRCICGRKGVEWDKGTFRLWCLWLVGLYLLPLGKVFWQQ